MYSKIRRKISTIGIRKTILFMASRLYNTLFHSSTLFFRVDLSDYTCDDKLLNKEVMMLEKKSFEGLTRKERDNLRDYGGDDLLAMFEKRLAKGYRLFIAYLNGEVAGACWVFVGGGRRFYTIPLSEREIMFAAGFTIDKFRRKLVFTTLLIRMLRKLKLEGFQRGFAAVKGWNFNQKTVRKVGFEFVGKCHEFRILKRNILIWSSVVDQDSL